SFDWDSGSTQCLGLLRQRGWELQIQGLYAYLSVISLMFCLHVCICIPVINRFQRHIQIRLRRQMVTRHNIRQLVLLIWGTQLMK
ncbi:hypothetical protein ABKV19_000324, partial [Rosa sericea]